MSLVRWRDGAFDITVMSKMADLDSTNYRLERVDRPVGTSDNAEADSGTHSPIYRLERGHTAQKIDLRGSTRPQIIDLRGDTPNGR